MSLKNVFLKLTSLEMVTRICDFQVLLSDFLLFHYFLSPAHKAEKYRFANLAGPINFLEE